MKSVSLHGTIANCIQGVGHGGGDDAYGSGGTSGHGSYGRTGGDSDDTYGSGRQTGSGAGSGYGGSGEDSTAGKLMEKAGGLMHNSKLEQKVSYTFVAMIAPGVNLLRVSKQCCWLSKPRLLT